MTTPHLRPFGEAFVAHNATVVGDVSLGSMVSIWYGAVVRGDVAKIRIGARTNIQDLTVVHPQHDEDVEVGDDCVIGHGVMVHGRTIGSRCLIGMGSILLPGSHVGDECLVAAGALVPVGMTIPPRSLVMGQPARIVRQVRPDELKEFAATVTRYLDLIPRHLGPTP